MNGTLILSIVIIIAGMAMLAAFLAQRTRSGAGAKAVILKSTVSVLFLALWGVLSVGKAEPYTLFIGGGLLFGLLGDIWLDLKFACREGEEDTYTVMGFGSFAIGHVLYVAAVAFGVSQVKLSAVISALGVALIAGCAVFFGEKLMGLNYGKYKMISTLYGALMFFMTSFALFSAVFAGIGDNKKIFMLFIGGVFFIISDLILSGTYFGEGKDRPVDIVTNHVTYYIAQYVIAATLLLA